MCLYFIGIYKYLHVYVFLFYIRNKWSLYVFVDFGVFEIIFVSVLYRFIIYIYVSWFACVCALLLYHINFYVLVYFKIHQLFHVKINCKLSFSLKFPLFCQNLVIFLPFKNFAFYKTISVFLKIILIFENFCSFLKTLVLCQLDLIWNDIVLDLRICFCENIFLLLFWCIIYFNQKLWTLQFWKEKIRILLSCDDFR